MTKCCKNPTRVKRELRTSKQWDYSPRRLEPVTPEAPHPLLGKPTNHPNPVQGDMCNRTFGPVIGAVYKALR